MTKQYEVTGGKIIFGPGFVLGLAEKQAQLRLKNLQKLKDGLYRVIASVEFKRGEVIGIPDGAVPKTMASSLAEIGGIAKKTTGSSPTPATLTLRHQGFGKYDVLDADGVVLTEKPLPKIEAQAFLDKRAKDKGL